MQLDLFKNSLPKKPYCTNNTDFGLLIRNANIASKMRYIQHNQINSKLWLVYDIDRAISPDEIEVAVPNLFIQNRDNCHAHLAYSLNFPVHLNDSSSQKPIRFAGAIDCAYQSALNADRNYVGLIMKNPLHNNWRTYELRTESYDLHELSEYVDLQPYADQHKNLTNYGIGRNCTLFENLRQWAYKKKLNYNNQAEFENAVLIQGEIYNAQFPGPLPFSEVKATASSISKWTWRNYNGKGKTRGRDALKGMQLDLHDKQTLAAIITNQQQKERTELLITQAIQSYTLTGKKITKAAIAREINMSRQKISKNYQHLFECAIIT
jgi:hypothetical protein